MYFFTDDIPYFVDDSFMRTHLRVDNLRPWFPLPPLCCGACARSRCWRSHYFSSSSPLFLGFWSSNCKYLEFFAARLLACLRNRTLHHQNGYHWTRPIVRRRRGRPRASKPIGALLNLQEWISSFFKCGFAFSFVGLSSLGRLIQTWKAQQQDEIKLLYGDYGCECRNSWPVRSSWCTWSMQVQKCFCHLTLRYAAGAGPRSSWNGFR